MRRRRSTSGTEARPAAEAVWPKGVEAWLPVGSVAVLHLAHLLFGGVVSDVALLMHMSAAALLAAALSRPALRQDLARLRGLGPAAVLFGLVLLAGLWSLAPWTPGGPHPVWSYVDGLDSTAIDRSSVIVELIKLVGLAGFFLVGALVGARDERARFAVQLTLVVGAVFALWALLASATGAIYQTQGHRLEARFLNPNTAGNLLAALFVLGVAALARELKSGRRRAWPAYVFALSALVLGVAVLATGSRGAVLAGLVALLVYFLLQLFSGGLKLSRALIGLLSGLAVLTLLTVVAGDLVLERFTRTETDAVVRADIWRLHWAEFLRSPLLGYGLGSFESFNKALLSTSNFEVLHNLRAPLNVYLQWLEEAGLLGAAPMFLCIAWLMWLTLRGVFARSRMTGLLAGLIALDVTFVGHGLTDSALQTPSIAAFWAWALGLQVALAQGSSRR